MNKKTKIMTFMIVILLITIAMIANNTPVIYVDKEVVIKENPKLWGNGCIIGCYRILDKYKERCVIIEYNYKSVCCRICEYENKLCDDIIKLSETK